MKTTIFAAATLAVLAAAPVQAQTLNTGLGISPLADGHGQGLETAYRALGSQPTDPTDLAAWKAKSFALDIRRDQRMGQSYDRAIAQLKLVIPPTAAMPAEQKARLKKLQALSWLIRGRDFNHLQVLADEEACDAYAELTRARTPASQAKAAEAARAINLIERHSPELVDLTGDDRAGTLAADLHDFRLPPGMAWPTETVAEEGATGYGAEIAAAGHRPMISKDYLQDAIAEVVLRGDAAEADSLRTAEANGLLRQTEPTVGQSEALEEQERLERVTYRVVRDEVKAGRRPQTDLEAAAAALGVAQAALLNMRERAERMDPVEHEAFHQRQLAEIAAYQGQLARLEAKLPGLTGPARWEADRAVARLRWDVHLHQGIDAYYQTHEPTSQARPNLPELPTADETALP